MSPAQPLLILLIFMGMKQNKILWKKKYSKCPAQKKRVFQNCQFPIFFLNISWIGPWISRIDWLMQRALMWLNLYGREAVRHNSKFFVYFTNFLLDLSNLYNKEIISFLLFLWTYHSDGIKLSNLLITAKEKDMWGHITIINPSINWKTSNLY